MIHATVACSQRAARRLQKLRLFLDRVGRDPAAIAAEVACPALLAPARMEPRAGKDPAALLADAHVATFPFPMHLEADRLFDWAPLPAEPLEFRALEPEALEVPMEYKLLGYQPQQLGEFVAYMPPLLDLPLAGGAPEHAPLPPPLSLVADGAEDAATLLDVGCPPVATPTAAVPLGARYARTNDAVAAPRLPVYGFDMQHPLEPVAIGVPRSAANEHPASNAVRATAGLPMLADSWQPPRGAGGASAAPAPMDGPQPEDRFAQGWVRFSCPVGR